MRIVVLIVGITAVLLGGLWLLQGLGIVHLAPILCVADCAPIERPSPAWTAIGLMVVAGGILAIYWSRRRPPGPLKD